MNTLDLIVCCVAAWAVWSGWRKGLVVQVCSLAGMLVAAWLAFRFGTAAGAWLHLDEKIAAPAGFALVLIAGIIAFSLIGRALRGIFHFSGLGLLDVLLGIMLSLLKFGIILSLIFSAFDSLNKNWKIVDESVLESSQTYKPLVEASKKIVPAVEKLSKSLPEGKFI